MFFLVLEREERKLQSKNTPTQKLAPKIHTKHKQTQTNTQEIKVAFLAWLLLPGTRGADVLFERALVPLLEEHGPALDALVGRARASASAHASEKAGAALAALRGRAAAAVAQLQAAAASAGAASSPAKQRKA